MTRKKQNKKGIGILLKIILIVLVFLVGAMIFKVLVNMTKVFK